MSKDFFFFPPHNFFPFNIFEPSQLHKVLFCLKFATINNRKVQAQLSIK